MDLIGQTQPPGRSQLPISEKASASVSTSTTPTFARMEIVAIFLTAARSSLTMEVEASESVVRFILCTSTIRPDKMLAETLNQNPVQGD